MTAAAPETGILWFHADARRQNQQMRRSRATVYPFLYVHTAILNDTLGDSSRSGHPGFRPTNDDNRAMAAAAWSPPRF